MIPKPVGFEKTTAWSRGPAKTQARLSVGAGSGSEERAGLVQTGAFGNPFGGDILAVTESKRIVLFVKGCPWVVFVRVWA